MGPAEAGRSGGLRGDADVLVVAPTAEADVTVGLGEECVVHADADVVARLEASAALAYQDAAGGDELPAEPLDPQHLGVGVATVSRAADTLLVRHRPTPRSW